MGGFYESVQVRSADRPAVKTAAEAVSREKSIRCLIGPELNGWVGIFPEDKGQEVSALLARQIDADVLHLVVHDDDVLAYWLWRKHELVDSYWSAPGCLGEENLAEEQTQIGNPQQFRPIIGDKADRLAGLLDREREYTFEGERLGKLAKLLGISNAVTSYDLLISDERDGIKGWRKFEKLPPDPPAAVKPKPPSSKSIHEKLKKSGLLLYGQEWNEYTRLLKGFTMGDGFVLGWINPWQKTGELSELLPPKYVVQPLPFDTDKRDAHVTGDLAVINAAESIRIMDKSVYPWRQIAEISKVDDVPFAAISPTREYIAHSNALRIVLRNLPGGDRVCEIPLGRSGQMAFHPTEKWLAASGDILGFICFDGDPRVFHLRVGGNKRVVIGNIAGIEEPGCIGFSRNGRYLWCGTNVGLRVYEWEPLSTQITRKARWWLRLHDELPSYCDKQVTAIAEEPDGTGIVFGTFAGKLARFDLQTGELHKLLDLPGGGRVETLMFSSDGKALAVASDKETRKGPRSMPKHVRAWEIWDYGKLRDSQRLIGRAEKKEPAPPSEAAPEDLSKWRRVTAKGFKR